jgi:hypothetical protein
VKLGSKTTLELLIHEITGIPFDALRGAALSHFTPEQRLRWALKRTTKKPEDRAYCLIGLCQVGMSLRYGEGETAFQRLEEKVRKLANTGRPFRDLSTGAATAAAAAADRAGLQNDLLASLAFPDMDARLQQIDSPASNTFEWLVDDRSQTSDRNSAFTTFLQHITRPPKIFWISGIPGSGKSTLMAYLIHFLRRDPTFCGAQYDVNVLLASYFFWSPAGGVLQKTIPGMLRTILHMLFEQDPPTMFLAIASQRWKAAQNRAAQVASWSEFELWTTLEAFDCQTSPKNQILLVIDGLDEIRGGVDGHEIIIAAIQRLAAMPKVRLCVSSRPLQIFSEAFNSCPRLRLQDLNHDDISQYVTDTLNRQNAFRTLCHYRPDQGQSLIQEIIERAQGVFLWVRLVVRDLVSCLRDGEGFELLRQTLDNIPTDLGIYFQQIFDSIDTKFQAEASLMLQVALFQETEFVSLQGLRLIDLALINDSALELPTQSQHRDLLDLSHDQGTRFKLSLTFRRLQSRCKGLLVCHYFPGDTQELVDKHAENPSRSKTRASERRPQPFLESDATFHEPSTIQKHTQNVFFPFDFSVEILHRSLHDFLLSDDALHRLHALTNGPIKVRQHLFLARLSQTQALAASSTPVQMTLKFYAAHLICLAATSELKENPSTLSILDGLRPFVENLAVRRGWRPLSLYVGPSLLLWPKEKSNFLTVAIDFDIVVYVERHLTAEQVRSKKGRPMLDYVLRPRFSGNPILHIGLRYPEPNTAVRMIELGADPNELYDGCPLIALYFCFMSDYARWSQGNWDQNTFTRFYDTTAILIRAGAATHLRRTWLSYCPDIDMWYGGWLDDAKGCTSKEMFKRRWGDSLGEGEPWSGTRDAVYRVADLLEHFRFCFGTGTDRLVSMLL